MNKADHTHLDLNAEQARLARAQAEHAEMTAALARGDLVPRQTAQQAVADGIERVRAKLLAQFSEIAPLVVGKTVAEAEAIIDTAVREALDELGDAADPLRT